MKNFFSYLIIFVVLFANIWNTKTILASESNSDENIDETVMVIIGKIPRPIEDVLGSSSVITRDQLDKQIIHNFNDLSRHNPDITVEQGGTRFGQTSIAIRGIGGNRVAMEVDGIPIADQFSIGSYSSTGRSFIAPELLQQIEILRGPASSVYGSDAIGGVVNFVRRKPRDLLSQTDGDTYFGISASHHGEDDSTLVATHGAFAENSLSGLISLSQQSGHEFDFNADLYQEPSSLIPQVQGADFQDNQNEAALVQLVYELADGDELSISHEVFKSEAQTEIQSILGLGRFRSTNGLSGDDESQRSTTAIHYDFEINSKQQGFSWLSGGSIKLFNQTSETMQFTDETRFSRGVNYAYDRDFYYDQDVNGIRFNLYSDFVTDSLNHRVGYGFEWSETKVVELRDGLQTNLDNATSTNVILSEVFPLRDFPISKIEEVGIYINNQIEIGNSGWSIVPAIRFDQTKLNPQEDSIYSEDNPATSIVDISDESWSPKLGIEYAINKNQEVYLQYVRGFRAPPFEDANIGLDIPLFNIRAIPNPDLKSESSDGYEVGYQMKTLNHRFHSTFFFNDYKDFIQTKVNLGLDPVSGRIIFQSQNLDRAKIYGGEIGYEFKDNSILAKNDQFEFSSRLYKSEGENKVTQDPLNHISPGQLILRVNWQSPNGLWETSLISTSTEAKTDLVHPDDQQLFSPPSYNLLDAYVQYEISRTSHVSFAILNMTDETYWNWSSVEGLSEDDPLLNLLSAPGRQFSLQYKMFW